MNDSDKFLKVSIVLFDTDKQILINCIDSLLMEKNIRFDIDVVCNNQNRNYDFLNMFKQHINCYHIKNRGYGNGHNYSITRSRDYKYHLVLNPDVIVHKRSISRGIAFLEKNPKIGMLAPKISGVNNEPEMALRNYPSISHLLLRRFFPELNLTVKLNLENSIYPGDKIIRRIPTTSGSFMLCNNFFLQKIEGFDERFFLYMEDVDLCRRINRVSEIVYFPKTSITHIFAKGSFKNFSLLKIHIASLIKYFLKYGFSF